MTRTRAPSGGTVRGGVLAPEAGHAHGITMPRWFTGGELATVPYHAPRAIEAVLDQLAR